jgi:pyridoxal phosphate enzyme (YggS family)
MSIATNLVELKSGLPQNCHLVAVSKTHSVESVTEAYQAGQRIFGENKVQELVPKYEALPRDIEWHMIGHLQSNKVKYIAPFISLIHSIDSLKLLEEVDRQGTKVQRVIPILLQVHIAHEETKFGFSEEEVTSFLTSPALAALKNIEIRGLMGMATFTENTNQVRSEFRGLHTFFDKIRKSALPSGHRFEELSMGMSGDYRIAIEEGSTMIRVGSAIFGNRKLDPGF